MWAQYPVSSIQYPVSSIQYPVCSQKKKCVFKRIGVLLLKPVCFFHYKHKNKQRKKPTDRPLVRRPSRAVGRSFLLFIFVFLMKNTPNFFKNTPIFIKTHLFFNTPVLQKTSRLLNLNCLKSDLITLLRGDLITLICG